MRLRRLWLLGLVAPLGCINVYHPEYHPSSTVTYVQNVSYPSTVVVQTVAPAASSGGRTERRDRRAQADPRGDKRDPSPPAEGGVSPGPSSEPVPPRAEAQADRHPSADVIAEAGWPLEDSWLDLFERERATLRAGQNTRGPADAWERVMGVPRASAKQMDLVVDVPLAQARALTARDGGSVGVMLEGEHTEHNGYLAEIRKHPKPDGLAQLLVKVDFAPTDATAKLAAMTFEVDGRRFLALGHIAGPAAETAYESRIRAGDCKWTDPGRSLSCNRRIQVASFDGTTQGGP